MQLGELLQAGLDARVHPGDELELRLAEVGGDARVRQRGAETGGMRRARERAVGVHPQALLFHAAAKAPEAFRAEFLQTMFETGQAESSWVAPAMGGESMRRGQRSRLFERIVA